MSKDWVAEVCRSTEFAFRLFRITRPYQNKKRTFSVRRHCAISVYNTEKAVHLTVTIPFLNQLLHFLAAQTDDLVTIFTDTLRIQILFMTVFLHLEMI